MRTLFYALVFISGAVFFLVGGGLAVDNAAGIAFHAAARGRLVVFFLSGGIALAGSIGLALRDGRRFAFAGLLFLFLAVTTVAAANVAASFVLPGWPLNALHGARPTVYWRDKASDFSSFNGWGQRDKERTRQPAPGITRIAFIGDSFLEESSRPISLVVEERLGPSAEVINLGISTTGPDEYFYRVKNVALPLGAHRVVVFYYGGNDAIQAETLRSFWGIAAVYPRDSLLSCLRLLALNHALTNRKRPFFRNWGDAQEIIDSEKSQVEAIATADDAELKRILLGFVGPSYRAKLAGVLERPEARELFDMVRRPDAQMFRSYLLENALRLAAGQRGNYSPVDPAYAYGWIKRTADLCRERGVPMTLVIIPEAFRVDARMQRQYAVLGNIRKMYEAKHLSTDMVIERAKADGLDVVNLIPAFDDQPGAHLNLDGHWSDQGLAIAAGAVTAALKERMK